jgi:hypothetical protein
MDNEPPNRQAINSIMNKFEQNGSVLNISPPGRPVSVTGQSE